MTARGPLAEALIRGAVVAGTTGALALAFYLTAGQALVLAGTAGAFAAIIRYLSGKRTGR